MLKHCAYRQIDPTRKRFKDDPNRHDWDDDVHFIHGKIGGVHWNRFAHFYCFFVAYKELFNKHMGR